MNPNLKQALPFFWVERMERSIEFYVHGLGFELKKEWRPNGTIEWCYIERDGVGLMLQEYRAGFMPKDRRGVGFSVCVICDDAIEFYHEVKSRGINAEKPFVGNNMWVTSVSDPDGYRLDFESNTDVPEGTEYSGE